MDDNMDSNAFLILPSPGRMSPFPDASVFYQYSSHTISSPEPGFSLWNFSDGYYDGNDNSSTLSLVPSASRPLGWPCEKTFDPEIEGEMEGDFNEMPRGGSTDYDYSLMLRSPSPKEWFHSVGNDDGIASSSTFSLVRSPSRPQGGWPCEKTFHPERESEMEGDFNEMLRDGSMDYYISLMLFSPSPKAPSPEALLIRDGKIWLIETRRSLLQVQILLLDICEGVLHSAYPKNESTRKTSKEMCRNTKNSITLEDLQQFPGSRMNAAKHFGVSEPTLKRRCRQLGITDWRHLKIRKKYQYLSKPKDIIESVHGDGAKMGAQMAGGCRSYERELDHEQIIFPPEFVKGTQMEITTAGDLFVSSTHERCIEAGHPLELPVQPSELNLFAACLRAPEGKLLMDDNISATEAFNSEQIPESNWKSLSVLDPAPKTSKKMCRNIKNSITLEDLQQFSGSRMDAAKHFEVSEPTLKRRCRQLGIADWRHRMNINSKRKDRIEFVHGDKAKKRAQMTGGCRSYERELDHEQIIFPPEFEKGTQMEITTVGDLFVSSTHEQCIEAGHPLELPVQPSELNLSAACLRADAVSFAPEGKLPKDHNISATEAFNSEQIPESNWKSLSVLDPAPKQDKATPAVKMPLVTKTQHTRTVTMKAEYGKDMIKFQLSSTSGINELKKEVAKRVMLEVGTFSIKYLDKDNDWILITCDEDLKYCFNTSILPGRDFVKLLIHKS